MSVCALRAPNWPSEFEWWGMAAAAVASSAIVWPRGTTTCSAHISQENGPFGLPPRPIDRGGQGEAKTCPSRAARALFDWVIRVPFVVVWRPKFGTGDVTNMAPPKASHVICRIMRQNAVKCSILR